MNSQNQYKMTAFTRYINDDYDISLQFGVPPCPVCGNVIKDSDKAVQCYKTCKRWFHKECINLRYSVYMKFEDKIKLRWSCERSECRVADVDDEFEDWTTMEGAELLVPERDRILILPENSLYPGFIDKELLTAAGKLEIIRETEEPTKPPKHDKELIAMTEQQLAAHCSTNELLETYNKKFGIKEKPKTKKKREGGSRMESIRNFFSKSDADCVKKADKKTKKTKTATIDKDF